MLELDDLTLTLGNARFRIDIALPPTSIHVLLGRSGSGKSTVLNLVAGFTKPDRGDLRWHGESLLLLSPDKRPVNTLFQSNNLFAHLTVAENVGLGLHPGLKLSTEQRRTVKDALVQVGLAGHESKRPPELSGGEQQRVGLARCLLRRQPILLMDEPFGALDGATRQDMLALTRDVITRQSPCTLVVTHDPDDAVALGAKVLRMEDGGIRREGDST